MQANQDIENNQELSFSKIIYQDDKLKLEKNSENKKQFMIYEKLLFNPFKFNDTEYKFTISSHKLNQVYQMSEKHCKVLKLGRLEENDIRIDEDMETISRRHGEFFLDEEVLYYKSVGQSRSSILMEKDVPYIVTTTERYEISDFYLKTLVLNNNELKMQLYKEDEKDRLLCQINVKEETIIIGKNKNKEFNSDERISDEHLLIFKENNKFQIKDISSHKFNAWRRIELNEKVPINNSITMRFGDSEVKFKIDIEIID